MADTIKVTCSECRKRSEIITPADDHEGEIIWVCPQQKENGDLCGTTNTTNV